MIDIPFTTDELRKFTSCLNLTTSSTDGEALAAVRAANRMLARYGMTWASFWYDCENQLRRELMEKQPTIDDAFAEILKVLKPGGFRDFIVSLKRRWEDTGTLSEKQREVIRNAL